MMLTNRYVAAIEYAARAHDGQFRKGTAIPYVAHLLGVSSLVLDHGGDEEQAIAGLLHDVVEDCGAAHEERLRSLFGDRVADIVMACTDGSQELKSREMTPAEKAADWRMRKERYVAHLADAPRDALLVSCCDKLHNARAIVSDLEGEAGHGVFGRFKAGPAGTLWYYGALAERFLALQVPPAGELARTVARMRGLAGAAP